MTLLLLAALAFPQSFEVASVRPNKSGAEIDNATGRGGTIRATAGQITMENVSLWKIVANAYGVPDDRDYAVGGPDWLRTERYDIAAKLPPEMPKDEHYREHIQVMLQKLLVERFKIQVHRETKQVNAYALVVDKDAPKFKPAADPMKSSTKSGRGQLTAAGVSMGKLADFLARFVDRPVVDQTELKGGFDFQLEWTPNEVAAPDVTVGPSLQMALRDQLGLRLQARKLPVEILVVDHAEKLPAEN